ncbi:MAG TPA: NUDIX domain-containing protein [Bacteroidales bacterium]|jgi:8-oxo-dGTP diphosphatase|nr:NUDIX domain-containing protein [Bacteroidales bacterium]
MKKLKTVGLNPHVSVDCVVFGFNDRKLKVLLIEREKIPLSKIKGHKLKLPGSLISEAEDLDISAARTLQELTGLNNIYLKQFSVFSNPDRLSPHEDLGWLRKTSGLKVDRVVTVAYYSLIKISESNITEKTIWVPVDEIPDLIFDHNRIIGKALDFLRKEIRTEPVCFELLPKKFTIRQMQNLYEAILGEKLDNRNFRKKIRPLEFLLPLNEKEREVNHKPAQLYKFDKRLYEKHRKVASGFDL